MKKIALLTLALAVVSAQAAPVPKAIKMRYSALIKSIDALNINSFEDFWAPDFKNIDDKGKVMQRKEYIASIRESFKQTKRATTRATFGSVRAHNGMVEVPFDFHLTLTEKMGVTKIHEIGTDTWKKVGNKWMIVKTADKSLEVTTETSQRG